MILIFVSSQALTPLIPSKLQRRPKRHWWTKPLLLPWKLLRNQPKLVARNREPRFLRIRAKAMTKRKLILSPKTKLKTLLLLCLVKLLTLLAPKRSLRY